MTQSAAGNATFSGQRVQFWLGTTMWEAQTVEPSDKINDEVVRRLGSQEIAAYTLGEYEVDNLPVTTEAAVFFADVHPILPDNGFGNFTFAGLIYMDHPTLASVRIDLLGCQFRSTKASMKVEPGATMMDLSLRVRQVLWNGKSLNQRAGATSFGASVGIGQVSAAASAAVTIF